MLSNLLLPDHRDVMLRVLENLTWDELKPCRLVSKRYNALASETKLYRRVEIDNPQIWLEKLQDKKKFFLSERVVHLQSVTFRIKPEWTITVKMLDSLLKLFPEGADIKFVVEQLGKNKEVTPHFYNRRYQNFVDVSFVGLLSELSASGRNKGECLSLAANVGDLACAIFWIKAGADVNYKDKYNLTPLFHAVQYGHVEIVKLLCKHQAKLSTVMSNTGPKTPLTVAREEGHKEIVKILEAYEKTVTLQSKSQGALS